MPVTANQMAAIRAYLEDDFERQKTLFNSLPRKEQENDFPTLVSAAVHLALEKGMSHNVTRAQVINFVAEIRKSYFKDPDALDPVTAERLILFWAGHDDALDGISPVKSVQTQFMMLRPLVHEAGIPESGLDRFLEDVQALANEWMEANEAEHKAE